MSLGFLLDVDQKLIIGNKVRFYTNVQLCGKNVTFVRNDDLSEGHKCLGKRICKPFYNELNGKDLVIINRGAHYSDTLSIVEDIDSLIPRVKGDIIYRTTVTGHSNCPHSLKPDERYQQHFTAQHKSWGWDKMRLQNEVIVEYLKGKHPTVGILDIVPMNSLRSDMHIRHGDCLHYCFPGPVDQWNELLMNYIINK
jgi:hypothetical protein